MAADRDRQQRAAAWFAVLRDRLCGEFEAIEDELAGAPGARFARQDWERPGGGGGTIAVMKGVVVEKIGGNRARSSSASSPRNPAAEIPGAAEDPTGSGPAASRWWLTLARRWFRRRT